MEYIKATDKGVYREENQDRAEVFENDFVLMAILCDGMGGHFNGSLAASITIETFRERFALLSSDRSTLNDWFKETIKLSKENMIAEAADNQKKMDMGTTVTSAIIFKDDLEIFIFNIGDSRTYLSRFGELKQITADHNVMTYYILKENLSEFQAAKLPGAHALISALGPTKKTSIEPFIIEPLTKIAEPKRSWFKRNNNENKEKLNEKNYIVLTSDGIHDYIRKPHFESIINEDKKTLQEKADELIKVAIKGGSSDNLTCIIVEV